MSAIAEVMIEPSRSAKAPNVQAPLPPAHEAPCWSWETSQLLRRKKSPIPMWEKAVLD